MLLSPSYSLFGGNEGSIHYLYAVSILWPLEMLIMYLMHRRNKSKGAEVWVQQDVGAVDLTPWKYSKLVSVIVIVCVLLVYLAFSPLGGCVAGVFQKNRYPSGHRCRHFLDGRRQNTGGLDVVFHIDINASIK